MKIREAAMKDAMNIAKLIPQVEAESEFMMMEAGERKLTAAKVEKMLETQNINIIVAENEEKQLVGYMMIIRGTALRTNHSAYLVVGILAQYRGKGIGKSLFARLKEWAMVHKLTRLELTVVTENDVAVALYKKFGFEIEGVKRQSLLKDGRYFDEYYMAKLLGRVSED